MVTERAEVWGVESNRPRDGLMPSPMQPETSEIRAQVIATRIWADRRSFRGWRPRRMLQSSGMTAAPWVAAPIKQGIA